mmetsp:Transcript_17613/g.41095  ORF Transcript_17613/g.41095 Transcript_17613/m.41095 type:complete len:302 (+) Transcript_17613:948-1853(+)
MLQVIYVTVKALFTLISTLNLALIVVRNFNKYRRQVEQLHGVVASGESHSLEESSHHGRGAQRPRSRSRGRPRRRSNSRSSWSRASRSRAPGESRSPCSRASGSTRASGRRAPGGDRGRDSQLRDLLGGGTTLRAFQQCERRTQRYGNSSAAAATGRGRGAGAGRRGAGRGSGGSYGSSGRAEPSANGLGSRWTPPPRASRASCCTSTSRSSATRGCSPDSHRRWSRQLAQSRRRAANYRRNHDATTGRRRRGGRNQSGNPHEGNLRARAGTPVAVASPVDSPISPRDIFNNAPVVGTFSL